MNSGIHVFCGMLVDNTVNIVDDVKCDPAKRFEDSMECHVPEDQCNAQWFSAPWTEVTRSFSFKFC